MTVLLIFRRGLATPFVIGSLVVGVVWLLALTMKLGIKINFVNFIAFPITFGIGVDYAVNVMARYLRDGGKRRRRGRPRHRRRRRPLLADHDRRLLVAAGRPERRPVPVRAARRASARSACLTTAVVVLPAVLMLVRPRSSPNLPEMPWDSATAGANGAENGGGSSRADGPPVELGP